MCASLRKLFDIFTHFLKEIMETVGFLLKLLLAQGVIIAIIGYIGENFEKSEPYERRKY